MRRDSSLAFSWFREEGNNIIGKNKAIFGDGVQSNSLNVNILPLFGRTQADS
jgi:hypothetical protein